MREHALVAHDPADALFARLDALDIAHETHAHPPVFTVEQAKRHHPPGAGLHTKNLFVRNKKGRMWLVTLEEDRPVDLKALGDALGAGNLSFGSPERLRRHLGVEPGSVTPLAVMNDVAGDVTLVVDPALLEADAVWCHPLTNDRTTRLSGADLHRFLAATGHPPTRLPS
ncbi:MAG: prolyl-tRNA synthetase associated domain-containing protein [Deltaproteobacteria bacterium]|nr:prolyl-tRNA synthetase associated domain-containing protein [Deltaproteobacteria bacterium]